MADVAPTTADEFIERQLDERLEALEAAFDADALCIYGDLVDGVDDLIRDVVEERGRNGSRRPRLVVILTTDGGYIETVHRIVDTLRHHYPTYVAFVIPNHAFSAGTVLAMSGDEIFMDYYSRLGPIDPQVRNTRGRRVPALGYLEQYKRLIKKANDGTITPAEAAIVVDGFDQAELYQYEQARELSITLLKEWLVRYKFKNWKKTRSRKRPVTDQLRKQRAGAIARMLNRTDRWHSHGHGISMAVLDRNLNLIIDDLDADPTRCSQVKQYDGLLSDYMRRVRFRGILHSVGKFVPYMLAS